VFGQDGFGMIAQTMMNMNTMLQNLMNKQSPKKQQEVELHISKSPKKPKATEDGKPSSASGVAPSLPLAIGDAEPFKPKLRTSAAEPSASKTVAEIEEQTFLALKEKSDEKKGAGAKQKAKAKAKGKSKAKAQPKAKGKVLKRPSSCLMEYKVRPPTNDDLLLDPNVYTSREWHGAKTFASKVLEMSDENAKVYAKGKREIAKELYKDAKKAKAK